MGDFNTPLTSMDISSRQKIYKETQDLSDTLDQMDLMDIYRALDLKAAEYRCPWNILQDGSHAGPQSKSQ